jgi:hypothetical protein
MVRGPDGKLPGSIGSDLQSDRDWSSDEPSAVVYAIVCGWHETVSEITEKFHWSEDQILRLERLRAGFVAQCHAAADD